MQIGPSAATDKESLLLAGKEGGPKVETVIRNIGHQLDYLFSLLLLKSYIYHYYVNQKSNRVTCTHREYKTNSSFRRLKNTNPYLNNMNHTK